MHSVKDDIPSQLAQSMNFQSTGQFACPVVHGALEPCVFGGKEGDSKDAPVVNLCPEIPPNDSQDDGLAHYLEVGTSKYNTTDISILEFVTTVAVFQYWLHSFCLPSAGPGTGDYGTASYVVMCIIDNSCLMRAQLKMVSRLIFWLYGVEQFITIWETLPLVF